MLSSSSVNYDFEIEKDRILLGLDPLDLEVYINHVNYLTENTDAINRAVSSYKNELDIIHGDYNRMLDDMYTSNQEKLDKLEAEYSALNEQNFLLYNDNNSLRSELSYYRSKLETARSRLEIRKNSIDDLHNILDKIAEQDDISSIKILIKDFRSEYIGKCYGKDTIKEEG